MLTPKHFFLIDPIEKLNTKKDSSLMLMLTMKELGHSVYAIYKKDLYLSYPYTFRLPTSQVFGKINPETQYLENVSITPHQTIELCPGDVIHMRLDPPFDEGYLKTLWALDFYTHQGIQVHNAPTGILSTNEKLSVFNCHLGDYPFVMTGNQELMHACVREWQKTHNIQQLIVKPINLFQGYGVVKVSVEQFLTKEFYSSMNWEEYWIVVPFFEQIYQGEFRCTFYSGELLGSIIKRPPEGSFLANIAQGAKYEMCAIPATLQAKLEKNSQDLMKKGIFWVAYDCIGEHVSEINVTCPGLLVELSSAHKENLALKIADKMMNIMKTTLA